MTIYRLTHNTFCDGRVGDFSLPRTLGYYATEARAVAARNVHIAKRGHGRAAATSGSMDWTDTPDYTITPIVVSE